MAFMPHSMSQLAALLRAKTEAEAVVASRGNEDQVAASELRRLADALDQTLQAAVLAGLPGADPVVAKARKLEKVLREMHIEVMAQRRACSDANTHSLTDLDICASKSYHSRFCKATSKLQSHTCAHVLRIRYTHNFNQTHMQAQPKIVMSGATQYHASYEESRWCRERDESPGLAIYS